MIVGLPKVKYIVLTKIKLSFQLKFIRNIMAPCLSTALTVTQVFVELDN